MFARLTSLLVVSLLAVPASGQEPAKKKDAAADILAKLREPAKLEASEATVRDFAEYLGEKLALPVVVNDEAFKQCGVDIAGSILKMPPTKGLRLRTILNTSLAPYGATFLVRKDHIEIVPKVVAAAQMKLPEGTPAESIVSVIAKEKPLNEVAADIAEEFDLNVVVAPQAGDSRMAFVSVRLLNVPADKALDVLATAAELRVVRKGNVFLITSRDHANELFGEKLDKERQKIELEKFRDAPAAPPVPQAPPPAKPEEKK